MKAQWSELTDDEKQTYREWTEWDKKRHTHELNIFQNRRTADEEEVPVEDDMQQIHVPKKRKQAPFDSPVAIPKKKKG